VYSERSVSDTYDHAGTSGGGRELVLERLQASEIGSERHDADVGLVAEHREHQHLMTVVLQRRDRVEHALGRTRVAVDPLTVDPVEEMQDAPTD